MADRKRIFDEEEEDDFFDTSEEPQERPLKRSRVSQLGTFVAQGSSSSQQSPVPAPPSRPNAFIFGIASSSTPVVFGFGPSANPSTPPRNPTRVTFGLPRGTAPTAPQDTTYIYRLSPGESAPVLQSRAPRTRGRRGSASAAPAIEDDIPDFE